MRYLGIDYGTKRVGIAISDIDGRMAFPKDVLPRNAKLVDAVLAKCADEKVGAIVIGESRNLSGEPNALLAETNVFKKELEKASGLPVYYEPEFYTSQQAERFQGQHPKLDASAASIILQSYLDREMNK